MALAILSNYIDCTKSEINKQISEIFSPTKQNLSKSEGRALRNLQKIGTKIKPADKNLGIVLLNTGDYTRQCLEILQDSKVYRRVETYPTNKIQSEVYMVLSKYTTTITSYDKRLKSYLQPNTSSLFVPSFNGIPKIHKAFDKIPPLRPIYSCKLRLSSYSCSKVFRSHPAATGTVLPGLSTQFLIIVNNPRNPVCPGGGNSSFIGCGFTLPIHTPKRVLGCDIWGNANF